MEAFAMMDGFPFRIHAFSTADELNAFAQKTPVEVLLIADRLKDAVADGVKAGKIILLADGRESEAVEGYESVCKYQPAEQMMKEILSYYAEYAEAAEELYRHKEFFVYGVYSPDGGSSRTVLAETLAGFWAERKKTLLLNLESYAASPPQRRGEEVWDLTDLIYFLRQGKKTFSYKLGSMVRTRSGFDEILPMKFPEDLAGVSAEEWAELFDKLSAESDYKAVVVDFGEDVNGLYELLAQCTEVYMPVLPDRISTEKAENFEWILREKNFERLSENIHKIPLPEGCGNGRLQSFMSEYVKRYVRTNDRETAGD